MVRVDGQRNQIPRNEVKEFQDMRSIGSCEACWRLFEFEMSDRFPSVKRLGVHLEKKQNVYLFEDVPITEALERAERSELIAFL